MVKISRREFLRGAAVTGAGIGAGLLPFEALAADGKSRIVIVKSGRVLLDRAGAGNANTPSQLGMASVGEVDASIDQSMLNSMIGSGMKAFTGATSEAAAWKKLFKPADIVGIKVNTLFRVNASTHPEVVASIIAGLKLAGVKEENIIVWDRNDRELTQSGFVINRTGKGVACYGTEGEYEPEPTKQGSFNGKLSRILTEKITALINVPILKDHSISGVTCAMKNHYGTHHNPSAHHGNNCDPFLAELNSIPAIREKTRLIICDALKPLAEGGPGYRPEFAWEHHSILIGADPVAMDYQGWQIIEEQREVFGLKPLAESGRPTKFINTAASLGLGTSDPAKMEIIRKTV
jgi:uncharacterized protein (DUF362 family)